MVNCASCDQNVIEQFFQSNYRNQCFPREWKVWFKISIWDLARWFSFTDSIDFRRFRLAILRMTNRIGRQNSVGICKQVHHRNRCCGLQGAVYCRSHV